MIPGVLGDNVRVGVSGDCWGTDGSMFVEVRLIGWGNAADSCGNTLGEGDVGLVMGNQVILVKWLM